MGKKSGGTGACWWIVRYSLISDYISDTALIVIIVGLALGLFGYDNAFASPLVSLPLFVEKYQGPALIDGTLVFSVIYFLNLLYRYALWLSIGPKFRSYYHSPSRRRGIRCRCLDFSATVAWAKDEFLAGILNVLYSWISSTAFCTESRSIGGRTILELWV